MANWLNIFGIAYGTVFESLFGLGRLIFKDYEETSHKKMWWDVCAAGLHSLSGWRHQRGWDRTNLLKIEIWFDCQVMYPGIFGRTMLSMLEVFRKSTLRTSLGLEEVHLNGFNN